MSEGDQFELPLSIIVLIVLSVASGITFIAVLLGKYVVSTGTLAVTVDWAGATASGITQGLTGGLFGGG